MEGETELGRGRRAVVADVATAAGNYSGMRWEAAAAVGGGGSGGGGGGGDLSVREVAAQLRGVVGLGVLSSILRYMP
jgi:hypothetical protein